MPASVTAVTAAEPRDHSIAARRAARTREFERERLIVDCLNRGVSAAEIAERVGVTEKRMRALVKEILARRMPAAPEDFVALQVSRLNEALLVASGAMSAENLRAVALVVRIVRELDRYHGFAAARRPRRDPGPAKAATDEPLAAASRPAASQETETGFRPGHDASERRQAPVPAPAEDVVAPAAPLGDRPQMAPQMLEKMESAPGNGAARGASDHMLAARPGPQNDVGAEPSDQAAAPPAFPSSAPDAPPCDGSEMAGLRTGWSGSRRPARARRRTSAQNPRTKPPRRRSSLRRRPPRRLAIGRKWRRKRLKRLTPRPETATTRPPPGPPRERPRARTLPAATRRSRLRRRRARSNFRRGHWTEPRRASPRPSTPWAASDG